MLEGWVTSPGERHHGAHSAAAAVSLGETEESFLDFSQNINPLGPPSGALGAARAAISASGVYPDSGYPELRRALAGYLGVEADHILPTNGGAEALFLAACGLARSGRRRALVLEPTFSEYAAAARAAGLDVSRRVAWHESLDGFDLDPSALDGIGPVDAVFLCNPNNPTGTGLPRERALYFAKSIRRLGAALVLDEAFADFAPEASLAAEADEHLVVARSFTKFFAVPGLRLGCLVTPEAAAYGALQPSWPVNVAADAAGIRACSDPEFARRSVEVVSDLRTNLRAGLDAIPGLRAFEAAANFLLVRGPAGMPERLARRGILLRGCEPFEGLGPEYFRVAVRGGEDNRLLLRALRNELAGEA